MIVVGVDFSEGSAAAVRLGLKLGAERDEAVLLVHVLPDTSGAWRPDAEAASWLQALAIHPAEVEVRRGVAWVELVRAAEERNAELLVAGTHGVTGYQPFRLGTTASAVAVRSKTPVVLAPANRVRINHKERR